MGERLMICRKCGKENSDNAKYGGNCGTKLVKKSRIKICILVCFLLGAMICCGIKRYEMPQQENSIKRDEIFQNKKEKTEKSIYKLNETFEIDGLSFTFTKVFASNNEYELWRTTDKSKVIAGFEGTVRNQFPYAEVCGSGTETDQYHQRIRTGHSGSDRYHCGYCEPDEPVVLKCQH